MAFPQTTYTGKMRPYVVGMVLNSRPKDVVSRIVADVAGIGFGLPVFQGASPNQVTATFTLNKFIGVTERDTTFARTVSDMTFLDKYKQGENCGVMREGVIGVMTAVAVAADDPAYITPAGGFTNVPNSGANEGPIGRWDSTTSGAALAKLELLKRAS